jgi:hypothetical protein
MRNIFDQEITGILKAYDRINSSTTSERVRSIVFAKTQALLSRYASKDFISDDSFELAEYLSIPDHGDRASVVDANNFSLIMDYLKTIQEMQSSIDEGFSNLYNRYLFEKSELERISSRVKEKSAAVSLYRNNYSRVIELKAYNALFNQSVEKKSLDINEAAGYITLEPSSVKRVNYSIGINGNGRIGDVYNSGKTLFLNTEAIKTKDGNFLEYSKKDTSVILELTLELEKESVVNRIDFSLVSYDGKEKRVKVSAFENGIVKDLWVGNIKTERELLFHPVKTSKIYIQIESDNLKNSSLVNLSPNILLSLSLNSIFEYILNGPSYKPRMIDVRIIRRF